MGLIIVSFETISSGNLRPKCIINAEPIDFLRALGSDTEFLRTSGLIAVFSRHQIFALLNGPLCAKYGTVKLKQYDLHQRGFVLLGSARSGPSQIINNKTVSVFLKPKRLIKLMELCLRQMSSAYIIIFVPIPMP